MNATRVIRSIAIVAFVSLTVPAVFAQQSTAQKPYEPTSGQEGKDVVWVPTPQALVEKMLDIAKVTRDDGASVA